MITRWSEPSSVSGQPEDVARLLSWLNLTEDNMTTSEDVMEFARMAVGYVERYQRRCLLSSTFTAYMDDWPDGGEIVLDDKLPIQSVTSVKYKAYTDGTLTTVTASNYHTLLSSYHSPARIKPIWSYTWPTLQDGAYDRVQVTVTAGYGTYHQIPMTTRAAIRFLVANFNEYRESIIVGTINSELPVLTRALDCECWGSYA